MNRPKKKKITNPTLPEDQQDYLDDRNLVDADASEEISFEDRAHIYWMENKGFVIGCALLLGLIIIAVNGLRIYSDISNEKVQQAYAEAVAEEDLEAFIEAHSGSELAGIASIEVADTAYAAEDFTKAEKYYNLAATFIEEPIFKSRAQIGKAFATYYSGEEEAGIAALKSIASDDAQSDAARAEAAYHLAIHADASGSAEDFDRYFALIENSGQAQQWRQRIGAYRRLTQ